MSAAQPALPRGPRAHDLPPLWDGRRVQWDGWTPTGRVCPPQPDLCRACGSTAAPIANTGTVYPLAGDTIERHVVKRTRSGREYIGSRTTQVRAHPFAQLLALRCPDCRTDTVLDRGRGLDDGETWWVLDDTDYTDDGSREP